jgi:glucose-1-phosphate adenylyltransferase
LNTNKDGSIYEFEEKPKKPKSNLASMGIYVFTAEKLFKYLEEDDKDPNSEKDFGKNILPSMLQAGEKMMSYQFTGYWKDVGTISSLWEANMDLLGNDPAFDVSDDAWKIHSRNPLAPPEYIGSDAKIVNSMVALGCEIHGTVEHSVLASNVTVEAGAVVKDAVIMAGTVIKAGARVEYSIIDEDTIVEENAVVGSPKDSGLGLEEKGKGISVIGRKAVIAKGAKVAAGVIIDAGTQVK